MRRYFFKAKQHYKGPTLFVTLFYVTLLQGSGYCVNSSGEDEIITTTTTPILVNVVGEELEAKPHPHKTVGPEDDEVHDDEIIEAVRNSLRLWQQGKANKTQHNFHNQSHHDSDNPHSRVKRDEEVVCYGAELGCFRDEGPFDYLDMLPSPPEEIATKFLLYAKEEEPEVFSFFNYSKISAVGSGSGGSSNWNASRPTKVIVHGFGSTCLRMWANEMRLALLSVVDCNVICVDWENGAALPNYVRAAVNTRLVGKQLSLFIRKLVTENPETSYQDFHLIGFSLGAHVAGFTGQELRNISRITGLDPAGPLFENYDKRVRLDSTDAIFVDVIHSNGDSLLMGGLGSWEPIGHLDFYPNGGRVQKGCSNLFLGAFRDFIWSSPTKETPTSTVDSRNGKSLSPRENDGRSLCNHRRAYRFFTESVSPRCPYPAFSCESYEKYLTGSCFQWDNQLVHSAHMGYYADQHQNNPRSSRLLQMQQQQGQGQGQGQNINNIPGQGVQGQGTSKLNGGKNFYLMTRDDEPFCANQYKLTLESSPPLGIPISTYGGVESILINANDDFNETFLITQTHKDNMISGSVLQKLVVAHPALTDPVKIVLKYSAYKGWIYSGISRWSLDRLILTNAFGISFCARGLLLPSGISVTVTLTKGICTVTNFPFRYPHIHAYLPPYNVPHNMIPATVRNEINDSLSLSPHQGPMLVSNSNGNALPGPTTINTGPSSSQSESVNVNADAPQSLSSNNKSHEFIDWSNDWHPIIMNKTKHLLGTIGCTAGGPSGANCTEQADVDYAKANNNDLPLTPPHILDGDHVNNEIDDGERRRSRSFSPIMLLPLSRAIEPRPVVLRTSRHMQLPPQPHPHLDPDAHSSVHHPGGELRRRPIIVESRQPHPQPPPPPQLVMPIIQSSS